MFGSPDPTSSTTRPGAKGKVTGKAMVDGSPLVDPGGVVREPVGRNNGHRLRKGVPGVPRGGPGPGLRAGRPVHAAGNTGAVLMSKGSLSGLRSWSWETISPLPLLHGRWETWAPRSSRSRVHQAILPGARDLSRWTSPIPRPAASISSLNTGKLGVTLDIETATGKELFLGLLEDADNSGREHGARQVGVAGTGLRQPARPLSRLIYTSVTPYGRTGPMKEYAGQT